MMVMVVVVMMIIMMLMLMSMMLMLMMTFMMMLIQEPGTDWEVGDVGGRTASTAETSVARDIW